MWKIAYRIPWNLHMIYSDSDLEDNKPSLILLGNRKEREFAKIGKEEDSGRYCDRCGAYITIIPWNHTNGLCRKCERIIIEPYLSKFPWGIHGKEETTAFSPIRRT